MPVIQVLTTESVSLKQAAECREHVVAGLNALDTWVLPLAN